MARQLHRDDYTVGWVCALPVELAAAQEMLDEEHPDLERDPADNDENLYALGSIGGHNVAIVCLPAGRIGNNPAAVLATQLRASFKAIRFGLMVGIGGGVPSAEADIRLGDVVVSQPHQTFGGVVQYDSGKTTPSGFARTGSLNSPPQILLSAVAKVRAKELRGRSQLSTYVSKLEHIAKFQRAKMGPDVLFKAGYDHEGGPTCDKCKADKQESRQPRGIEEEVVVHYGTIASGNQVTRSAAERDRVSAELGEVLCFEMEAAGLMNSFPCLVVRGVCDYADSHKNKRWQPYAAGAAAAYAKEVLSVIPPSMVEAERKISEVLSDLYKVAEDFKNIAGDGLAISQKAFDIQRKEHDQKLSDQQARCLQLFRLTQSSEGATYEWYKERIAGRVEGTCLWFLNHPHFQEWRRSESGPLLVSADPGCGKSVLAKYLIDHVLAESSTVCYFFFKDQVQSTVREALCALLHQLFSQKRSLLVHAMEQYDKDGAGLVNSTSSLWSVFREAVQDVNAGPVTIVLDALDECAKSETRDLLQHIESQVRKSESSKAKLKLLMTSRPYEYVVSELHSLSEAFPRIRIPGEEESETISQEVNLVIKYRVERLTKEKKLKDDVKNHLADMLLKITHRTYLWTYLVFDFLKTEDFKRTPRGVESAIATLPKSVNQAYERILNKSKEQKMVRKALGIILAACRPLTLSEINVAVNIESTSQSIHNLDLEEEEDFKSRLRSWCGLFVSIHHGQIYFIHQTAREFLLANLRSSATIPMELQWHHSVTIEHAHTVLAELCVRYLNFFGSDASPPTHLTRDASHHEKSHAFLDYSAKFWVVHFRVACISKDDTVIAPFASRISDPDSTTYLVWSQLYWKAKHMGIPRFTTGLTVASYFGHSAVAGQLVDKGADLESKDERYARTPLSWAATNGHEAVVRTLLEKGADLESKDERYARTPLSWAAANGHEAVVKMLLEKGADLESKDEMCGKTPLSLAATNGHEAVVKMLLEKGADVESKDKDGHTPLWWATTNRHEVVAKLLVQKGADLGSNDKVRFASSGRYRTDEEDVITPVAFPSYLHNSRTRGTMGLTNLGNTGWMNSALQCIRSIEELAGYFLQGKYKQDTNVENPIGYRGAMAKVYARLLAVLYSEEGTTSFEPKYFRNQLSRANPWFSGYEQRSATEFLGFLIDALHEDLNRIKRKPYIGNPESDDQTVNDPEAIKALGDEFRSIYHSRNDSVAMDLFNGFYKVVMLYPECDKVSITFEPYTLLILQLPIEQSWIALEECFAETYKAEVLPEANSWYCNCCKELRRATKKLEIWTAPDILLVELRRFSSFHSSRAKIDALVDFPIEGLDLTNKVGLPEERKPVYDLFAVINHYDDGPGRGVYTAFAKNFFDQQWYEYNNSSVRKRANLKSVITSAAYVLCYRRRSNGPLGPPELREIVQAWRNSNYEVADDAG